MTTRLEDHDHYMNCEIIVCSLYDILHLQHETQNVCPNFGNHLGIRVVRHLVNEWAPAKAQKSTV